MGELSLTLSSPLTEEQWDMIIDVDFDNTNEITFHTKHGKEVKFVKAQPEIIRCKDCNHKNRYRFPPQYEERDYCEEHEKVVREDCYCAWAERR